MRRRLACMESLSRAWKDTKRFFGWNKRTGISVGFWVVGAALLWIWRGVGAVMDEFVLIAAFTLAPGGLLALTVFSWNLIAAPYRRKNDECARLKEQVGDLEEQLGEASSKHLDLHVRIGWLRHETTRFEPPPSEDWIIVTLEDVSITNRSRSESVTLRFYLKITVDDGQLWVGEHETPEPITRNPSDLRTPLIVPPEGSVKGDVVFSLHQSALQVVKDRHLTVSNAGLKIVDLVSGEEVFLGVGDHLFA